jgi:type I site-specific restriction-modification system R (restriction) subunit
MLFFSKILRKSSEFKNPTILIQIHRNDLDKQLFDQFVLCASYIGNIQHAESVDELRSLLRSEGGEIIFSTIEKFQLKEEETEHPILSLRENIIVIADEAHRTQYGHDVKYAKDKKDLLTEMFGYIIEEENRIQTFLELEYALAGTYSLVSHLKEISLYEDEIAIYQLIRNQVHKYKTPPNRKTEDERNKAIRSLLDKSISSSEVKDIFAMVGIPTPDVSIITDDFLRDFQKDKKHEDLRLKLLEKILYDAIHVRLGVKTNRQKTTRNKSELV